MTNLYEYPSAFLSETPRSLSRAARVWCLGGVFWMLVAAGLFLLSYARMGGLASEWGAFCPAGNPGILRQAAFALLVYGWGVPLMFGLSLLICCRDSRWNSDWSRAGAWGWHAVILWGVVSVLGGWGSGISMMPFPFAVWPVLIMACVPTVFFVLCFLWGKSHTLSARESLSGMSVLLAFFYLLGGVFFVFVNPLPAFYRTLAAECTTYGLSFGVCCSFVLSAFIKGDSGTKRPLLFSAYFVFVLAQTLLFTGFRTGAGSPYIIGAAQFLGLVAAIYLCRQGDKMEKSGKNIFVSLLLLLGMGMLGFLYFQTYMGNEFAGSERGLSYFMIMMGGVFSLLSAFLLYAEVPRCTGRDWFSRRALSYPLYLWQAGIIVFIVGMIVVGKGAEASNVLLPQHWQSQALVGSLAFLLWLGGSFLFALHVLLVWTGWGRISGRMILAENEDEFRNAESSLHIEKKEELS